MKTYNYKNFLKNIVQNTDHTITSLSEILDISKKKLKYANQLSQQDSKKIDELRKILVSTNYPWLDKKHIL